MSIKRTIITTILALALVAVVAPAATQATTISDLMAQIAALQAQLTGLSGGTPVPTGNAACAGVSFTRNLTVGSTGSDVKCLQILLNNNGYTLAATGAGSPGAETTYFGTRTLAVVKQFQAAKGMVPANQVGPMTRAALNALLGGTVVPPVNPPVVIGGGLSVALAYDTPAATSVATNANANFTKVTLTAGSGTVNISNIYVTRSGLSGNADLQNIEVVDAATGVYYGNIASLNSDNRAMITFTQPLVITAGSSRSFYLRAGFPTGTTAGKTAALGIVAASDITSNASSTTGTFPAMGSAMTCVNLTIGSLTIAEDGTTVDSKPNIGNKQVVLNNFKLTAGSTEDVSVETISMLKAGTISNSYLANLTLVDVTKGTTLGTVANLTAEGKAAFTALNVLIGKGNSERFQIRADIVDGPSQTANADLVDGTNVLVTAKGTSYGFYITPSASGWGGQGANSQTINAGASTISRSTVSPATGNISAGDSVPLATFDFYVTGEAVRVSSLKLTATLGTMVYGEVTAVKVYDENGTIVAGPKDLASDSTVTITDVFVVPTGTHKYTVKAKIASTVSTNDTILMGIAAGTDVTGTGMTDNASIAFAPAATAVNGNTQTIKAGALVLATNTAAVHSVAKGTKNFIYGTTSLDASNSGEDIQVSAIGTSDAVVAGAVAGDLQNMTLWADLTSDNSSRGDIYETQISNPVNQTAAATAFSLTRTVIVPKGGFTKVALIADLATGALTSGTPTHTITFTVASTTANGASTGSSIASGSGLTASGSGRAMTNATTGTLSVTKDSSSPVADILLGGQPATLGVFRLAETSNVEGLNVNDITLSVTGGAAVDTFYFYNGSTLLGSVSGGTAPKLVLGTGVLTVPANSNVKVTVKALLLPVDGSTVTNGTAVTPNIYAAVNSVGLSSGSAVTSSDNVTGVAMTIEKARPYFALSTSPASPTGVLYPSANTQLAIFNVANTNGGDDVVFSTAASSQLIFNISKSMNTSAATARTYTLTDGAGTTYSTASVNDITSTTVTFSTWATNLTIPVNGSKTLYVIGDTTGFSHQYDSIQLSLQATDANCTYSIGTGTAQQAYGSIIFKGNIYAGSLQHP